MAVLHHGTIARPRPAALAPLATSMVVMAVAATGWWWTVHQGDAMASMALGLAQVGRAMPLSMGTAAFMGMWAAMIGAMMLPSIAPLVLGHPRARDPLAETSSRVAFLAGYLVLWVLVGVPALLALTGLSHLSHPGAWLDRAGGTILVAAGAYQFTRAKRTSIGAYRAELVAIATDERGRGPVAASSAGLREGLRCLRCGGALMAVLLVVGMNVTWMAAITAVFATEKNWRDGAALTGAVGVALVGLGLAVLAHPQFLTTLAPAS
jgi:predicted metal-binding membrane protein